MTGILLISHGMMAEGMKDSVALIMGEADNLQTASLVAGQDFDAFKADVVLKIEALDRGDGVLVFVDLFGASPYNAAMLSVPALAEQGHAIRIITGMNLPMVMESLALRDVMPLEQLAQSIVASGRETIMEPVSEMLGKQASDEDDGDY